MKVCNLFGDTSENLYVREFVQMNDHQQTRVHTLWFTFAYIFTLEKNNINCCKLNVMIILKNMFS